MARSERLTIPNADGHALAARLDLPDGEPVAYALFAHCFTCTKDLHAVRRVADGLTAQGLGVLSVDFTGLGQSEGAFAETTFSTTVADLVSAAASLAETHAAPQLLVGHSLGGAAVLVAAGALPGVRAVATIGAPYDPAHVRRLFVGHEAAIARDGEALVDLGGRPFTIRQAFLDDLDSQARMHERIGALGRALLVFHSPTDASVDIENARLLYDAARHPKSFVSLDGADHLLTDPADAAFVADVLAAWAARYLRPAPPEAAGYDDPTTTATLGRSGFQTTLRARGFELVADEPASAGGTETGPTPYDLLGMALGACTAMTLRMYADRKGLPLTGVAVDVTHAHLHADDCAACETTTGHLSRLTRTVRLEGDLDADARAQLLAVADKCPVHKTLEGEIDIVTVADPATAASA